MQVTVITDAKVLTPNNAHKNFTETKEVITAGTKLDGDVKKIEGLRKGEPFVYRIFKTKDNKIIYLNKTKPMERTEVSLGADSAQTPTIVKLPSNKNFGPIPLIGTATGLVLAHFYIKKKGFSGSKRIIHYLIGAAGGFAIGKFLQSKKDATVKPSK